MTTLGASESRATMPPTSKYSDVVSTFRPTKIFKRDKIDGREPDRTRILSLDYSDKGDCLVTTEDDDSLQFYNVESGKQTKSTNSKKYGARLARFTHATNGILHASAYQNDQLRYLDTHTDNYIRYFEGHEGSVTCLEIHPGNDHFISCSLDNTVRLWDLSTRTWTGKLLLRDAHLAAYDPSATTFAVGSASCGTVLLYDVRNFDKAPFSTFDLVESCRAVDSQFTMQGWTKLEFSNDGKSLLVGTRGGGHYVLDAFSGDLKAYLRKPNGGTRRLAPGEKPSSATGINGRSSGPMYESSGDCAFSLDGCYVLGGSKKDVLVWDVSQELPEERKVMDPTYVLEEKHEAAVLAINPRYNFFATGDQELVFWLPNSGS
jgi:COMPASS component SWD2